MPERVDLSPDSSGLKDNHDQRHEAGCQRTRVACWGWLLYLGLRNLTQLLSEAGVIAASPEPYRVTRRSLEDELTPLALESCPVDLVEVAAYHADDALGALHDDIERRSLHGRVTCAECALWHTFPASKGRAEAVTWGPSINGCRVPSPQSAEQTLIMREELQLYSKPFI